MTNLWHHVYDLDRLREAYFALNREGAAGIDGETWRMHRPVPETGLWLRRVVQGYYNYHAVPRNLPAMTRFTRALLRL